jgi:hypothetical protein
MDITSSKRHLLAPTELIESLYESKLLNPFINPRTSKVTQENLLESSRSSSMQTIFRTFYKFTDVVGTTKSHVIPDQLNGFDLGEYLKVAWEKHSNRLNTPCLLSIQSTVYIKEVSSYHSMEELFKSTVAFFM